MESIIWVLVSVATIALLILMILAILWACYTVISAIRSSIRRDQAKRRIADGDRHDRWER